MTRIYNAIQIQKPIAEVFDYVTTARNWTAWHPSSLGVRGAIDHPGQMGEQITERFFVAGNHGTAVWTVRERDVPRRWVIDGIIKGRGTGGTVTYTLTLKDGGTFFEREFTYPAPTLLFALLDALIFRRRVQAESELAVQRLKRILEADK